MPIRPRYKLFSSREGEKGRLEIENLAHAGAVEIEAYPDEDADVDNAVTIFFEIEDIREIAGILNAILESS